jgi:hypothetical protein
MAMLVPLGRTDRPPNSLMQNPIGLTAADNRRYAAICADALNRSEHGVAHPPDDARTASCEMTYS